MTEPTDDTIIPADPNHAVVSRINSLATNMRLDRSQTDQRFRDMDALLKAVDERYKINKIAQRSHGERLTNLDMKLCGIGERLDSHDNKFIEVGERQTETVRDMQMLTAELGTNIRRSIEHVDISMDIHEGVLARLSELERRSRHLQVQQNFLTVLLLLATLVGLVLPFML